MYISAEDASTYISAMTLRVRFNGFNLSPEFIKYADDFYQTYKDNELKRDYEFEACEELSCSDDIMIQLTDELGVKKARVPEVLINFHGYF